MPQAFSLTLNEAWTSSQFSFQFPYFSSIFFVFHRLNGCRSLIQLSKSTSTWRMLRNELRLKVSETLSISLVLMVIAVIYKGLFFLVVHKKPRSQCLLEHSSKMWERDSQVHVLVFFFLCLFRSATLTTLKLSLCFPARDCPRS